MRNKALTWEELQAQDPKQTVAVVRGTPRTRVVLGEWYSREEAWTVVKGWTVRKDTQLLRLGKVLKWLDQERPKDVSAISI